MVIFTGFVNPISYPLSTCSRHGSTKGSGCGEPRCTLRQEATACRVDPSVAYVLSHFEAADLLSLRLRAPLEEGEATLVRGEFSVDVGLRTKHVMMVLRDGIGPVSEEGAAVEKGGRAQFRPVVTWDELGRMTKKRRAGAFEVFRDGQTAPRRIAGLSEATGMAASLMPVVRRAPPTLVLSGFTMHRVVRTDPGADTRAKLDAIRSARGGQLGGKVLDVCTGLAYTALSAAAEDTVESVITIERDPIVRMMHARNPWSQSVLQHPKITRVSGDASIVTAQLEPHSFDVVLHDPPAKPLAGDLYGRAFYRTLFRTCKKGATLFHYIGDPASKDSGRLYRGVVDRMRDVGFRDIKTTAEAFGITATRA